MGLGFTFKNIQQYRVDSILFSRLDLCACSGDLIFRYGFGAVRFGRRHHAGIGNLTAGQGVGAGFEVGGIEGSRTALLEIVDQGRQAGSDILQKTGDVIVHEDAAVDNAVQHVFHGPGQFANNQRADHTATAFQRVEGTANF